MYITARKIFGTLRAHWFFLAAVVVVSSDLFIGTSDDWSNARLLEIGIILDLTIFIPGLYLWCYHSRGKVALLRALALSCLGVWAAGYIVPSEHHLLVAKIAFIRYIGIAILLVIQLKLMARIYRAAFHHNSDATSMALKIVKDEGMPEWIARILAWEASVWRKAWDAVRRMFDRD